ncbi:acetyl-CoA carboxylase carboxyl transferase subunit [Streptacidiphilus anmyonensis]|uniref:acetyl-CoA carboxylase carboxyl transferase subunit n=1 Tax=Streptacidiphilus anmyonensis TaxID=405782 RepID=UPI0005AB6BB3|nr:acetyl-CoA carboxylase carboxyl transferase subunit [Streptacidiphilus anmyonensis]
MVDVEGPTDAWVRCDQCVRLIYDKRFIRSLRVCPDCGTHARLTAPQRLDQLLDPGSALPIPHIDSVHDPLDFVDTRPYPERLLDARAETGLHEAVVCVRGTVEGWPVVVAAMDFRFLGGSLGCSVGALITEAARTSLRLRVPLLLVTASGGARMQEGALSLMQMAKTSQALAELDEAGILVISLITDPTYGGVAASFATLADVILAEPGARLGFAGPRVIEQTIGETLPPGFQTAEFLLRHGLIDDIVPRAAQRTVLAQLLALQDHRADPADPAPEPGPAPGPADLVRDGSTGRAPEHILRCADQVPAVDSWTPVQLARHCERPTILDYAAHLLDGFHELHGDRLGADCPAVVGGPGRLNGRPIMLIGHHKGGSQLAERQRRSFGMPSPAGYRKAARLMRMAAKLRLPVVTLVDTPGAYPGPEAERNGQAVAIAENLRLMAGLPVPIVAVVTGEGGSGGALALAVADRVLICENGIYSVISPEGCAAILWKDSDAASTAASALRVGAAELLRLGIVNGVVPEPPGGAHTDPTRAAALLGAALEAALDELDPWEPRRLVRARRDHFHRFGVDEPNRALKEVTGEA